MQKLDVRVLGEFVLVKQVMKKKNSRIITDAAKDENEKFLKLISDFCIKDDKEIFDSILSIYSKIDFPLIFTPKA